MSTVDVVVRSVEPTRVAAASGVAKSYEVGHTILTTLTSHNPC
jgi:hypothetical protein